MWVPRVTWVTKPDEVRQGILLELTFSATLLKHKLQSLLINGYIASSPTLLKYLSRLFTQIYSLYHHIRNVYSRAVDTTEFNF